MFQKIKFLAICALLYSQTSLCNIDSLETRILALENQNKIEEQINTEIELVRQYIFYQEDVEKGLKIAASSIKKAKTNNFPSLVARLEYIIGFTEINYLNNYNKGIDYYFQALKYYESSDDYSQLSGLLINLGTALYEYGSYVDAIKYSKLGLKYSEKENDLPMIADFKNNIAACYDALGDYPNAKKYWSASIKTYKSIDDEFNYHIVRTNMASSQILNNPQPEEKQGIIDVFLEAIPVFEKYESYKNIIAAKKNLGTIYNETKQYKKARKHLEDILKIAEQTHIDISSYILVYQALANNYKATDLTKKEAEVLRKYIQLSDSLAEYKKYEAIEDTKTKYETDKKEKENKILKQKEIIQKSKLENEKLFRYMLSGGIFLVILSLVIVINRFLKTRKQKNIIEEQKNKVDYAYSELETKNNEIMDSISYAKRIQAAILPPQSEFSKELPNSFVLYKPKDIVAGDFYWMEKIDNKLMFAAADCTGHGVPGAMVSVVCNNGLNRSVRELKLKDPGKILDSTREIVIKEFEKSVDEVRDGMDIALVTITPDLLNHPNEETYDIQYAGAHNPLWIIRKGSKEIEEIKANKQPIGRYEHSKDYKTHTLQLSKGDCMYIFSDGFVDQFGGEDEDNHKPGGKKFKSKNFKKLLIAINKEPMYKQKEMLNDAFVNWKGRLEQIDDVCVVGVRI